MKSAQFIFFSLFLLACNSQVTNEVAELPETVFQDGDIIFQTSTSSQSEAIQLATNSKYSHVGILFENNGEWFVFEAIQPVSITPVDKWIARGKDAAYIVKRLKDPTLLNQEMIAEMRNYGQSLLGKPYDLYFEWSDEKIYCSELVWKIYAEVANIELCSLKTFGDYDFENALVQAKLQERYDEKLPMAELVVSPDDLFRSELLREVE